MTVNTIPNDYKHSWHIYVILHYKLFNLGDFHSITFTFPVFYVTWAMIRKWPDSVGHLRGYHAREVLSLHLTREETERQRLSDLCTVTQLRSGKEAEPVFWPPQPTGLVTNLETSSVPCHLLRKSGWILETLFHKSLKPPTYWAYDKASIGAEATFRSYFLHTFQFFLPKIQMSKGTQLH